MGQRRQRSTVLGYGFSFCGFPSTFTRLAVNISIYVFLRVPKIVLGLPSFSIITAPIDQIFVGIRKVRSLALYAFNDPFFCTSLPLRSQRLSTMDLVVDPNCTSCYTNSNSNSNSKFNGNLMTVQWQQTVGGIPLTASYDSMNPGNCRKQSSGCVLSIS